MKLQRVLRYAVLFASLLIPACRSGSGGGSQTGQMYGKYKLFGVYLDQPIGEQKARENATDVLTQLQTDKNLCLIGLWAYNPPAVLSAVKDAGRTGDVKIVGFDEDFATLQGIQDGQIYGTVVQDPFGFGYEAVKILSHMVRDGDDRILKSYKDLDNLNRIVIPHRVITKEAGTLPETNGTLPVDPFYAELKKLKGDVQ